MLDSSHHEPQPPPAIRAVVDRAVRRALEAGCDGRLVVSRGGEPLGFVMVVGARVAWAVSRRQREDLGSFLARLGKLRRGDLDTIRRRFQQLGGRRKFGALLEESGLLRRSVLRRCLLLHTRMAFEGLRAEGSDVELDFASGTLEADAELTFELDEIMPQTIPPPLDPAAEYHSWHDENSTLLPAREIPGYQASMVLKADGEVLMAHVMGTAVEPASIAVLLATVLERSTRAATASGLGAVEFVLLECERATVLARWLDEPRRHLLATLIECDANLGMAKYRIQSLLPAVREWLRQHAEAP